MDFVLVVQLILVLVSSGQSLVHATERDSDSCVSSCPPGFYKIMDCKDPAGTFHCEKCPSGTYTAIENSIPQCIRCKQCERNQVVIQECSHVNNTQCGCKEGYFLSEPDRICISCKGIKEKQTNDKSDACLKNPKCKKKCITSTPSTSTEPSTTIHTISVTENDRKTEIIQKNKINQSLSELTASDSLITTKASNKTKNPAVTQLPPNNYLKFWPYLVIVMSFLVLLMLLLCFIRNLVRSDCLCWRMEKAEDPKFSEQRSHHGNSPTTLTFTISEEIPIMSLCNEPSSHISPCLPHHDHKVAQQNKQSDRWPAIVLYAIIKEVPLRRWKEFLRLLSLADQEMERVELEAGLGSIEKQYQMLRLWSQRPSASLNDIYSSLHYMELSGCVQQLQESLEKLQWRPEERQGVIA